MGEQYEAFWAKPETSLATEATVRVGESVSFSYLLLDDGEDIWSGFHCLAGNSSDFDGHEMAQVGGLVSIVSACNFMFSSSLRSGCEGTS